MLVLLPVLVFVPAWTRFITGKVGFAFWRSLRLSLFHHGLSHDDQSRIARAPIEGRREG